MLPVSVFQAIMAQPVPFVSLVTSHTIAPVATVFSRVRSLLRRSPHVLRSSIVPAHEVFMLKMTYVLSVPSIRTKTRLVYKMSVSHVVMHK